MTEQSEMAGRAPVQLVRAPDPLAEARALAGRLGGDVAGDLPSAEREVRTRVEAGRRALSADQAGDADLLACGEQIRLAATAAPAISDEDVAELQRLASDLARASRIRIRTEARFNENLQAKLAASTGLALHPGAIRSAAEAVVEAEKVLAVAERALLELGPAPGDPAPEPEPEPAMTGQATSSHMPAAVRVADGAEDPILRRPLDDFDEEALDKRRSLTRGLAVFFVIAGAGVATLGLGQPIAIAVAAAAIGAVLGALVMVRGRRVAGRSAGERTDQAARLADLPSARGIDQLAALAPDDPPAPLPAAAGADTSPAEPDEAWLDARVALDSARDEAEEQVRLANRRWRQLVGPDADPHHPDDVVRAHDPQLAYDARVAEASPTVRTVAAFHRTAQARWKVLWAAVGREHPPEPQELDAILDGLLGDNRRARAELRRLEAAEARARAQATAQRPLVLIEPRSWVAPGRLAQLLSSIPPDGQVVLVERDERAS